MNNELVKEQDRVHSILSFFKSLLNINSKSTSINKSNVNESDINKSDYYILYNCKKCGRNVVFSESRCKDYDNTISCSVCIDTTDTLIKTDKKYLKKDIPTNYEIKE